MACKELAALRLGMMKLIGIDNAAVRQHELVELGDEATVDGPLKSLTEANSLESMKRLYQMTLTDLAKRVAKTPSDDPRIGYYRCLMVLTRKVELELDGALQSVNRLFQDLDSVHDYMHELFPDS